MDYYSILGVGKTATQEEIKQAYKKLAKEHHPDRGGDNAKFSIINEAYETLKDANKRANYDNPKPQVNIDSQNFHDVFSAFFNNRNNFIKNKDIKISINIELIDVLQGKDLFINYKMYNGRDTSATIRIHQGVLNGEIIKYKNLGDDYYRDIPKGDLLILVKVNPHKIFERDGSNLKTTISINVLDLILGTSVIVEKLSGESIKVTVPPYTQPNTILSVSGQGLPDLKNNRVGNLYIHIKGIVPKINDNDILQRIKKLNDEISIRT